MRIHAFVFVVLQLRKLFKNEEPMMLVENFHCRNLHAKWFPFQETASFFRSLRHKNATLEEETYQDNSRFGSSLVLANSFAVCRVATEAN